METERAYVNPDDNTVLLRCPHCGTTKSHDVGKFKGSKRRVKVKCSCQEVFRISFEFRKTPRRETHRAGHYTKLPEAGKWHKMLATDISITDIGFTALSKHDLKIGDELKVRFTLDDDRRSRIERKAVVKRVKDMHIGCEFAASLAFDVAAKL